MGFNRLLIYLAINTFKESVKIITNIIPPKNSPAWPIVNLFFNTTAVITDIQKKKVKGLTVLIKKPLAHNTK